MSISFARNLKTKIHLLPKNQKITVYSKSESEKFQIDLDEYTISHVHQQISVLFKDKQKKLGSIRNEFDRALWIAKNGVHETDQKIAHKKS